MAKPEAKNGKKLSEETLELVHSFYEGDEYSKQMLGKKDCISVGIKQYKQKHLVLCNLKEMHTTFKEKTLVLR